jgi:16S rRNA (guanine527-N7)-methyltransferase
MAKAMAAKNTAPEKSLSIREIRAVLESFELTVPDPLCEEIRSYTSLLLLWNRRISLTSITSPEEIVRTHFAESLLATKAVGKVDGRLADVGTGAGFPGIPLKMYIPALRLSLIEPNVKKCAFLAEVVRALELKDVEIIQKRYEDVRRPEPPFDIVTSRALGQFLEFAEWTESVLAPNGRVMVWTGPDGRLELERRKSLKWLESYAIPRTKHRLIVSGVANLRENVSRETFKVIH